MTPDDMGVWADRGTIIGGTAAAKADDDLRETLAALVEVDPGTGEVEVVDVSICEDLGRVVNPTLVEGQIQGGIVQALGEALYEELVYDDRGTLTNGTFVDYHSPTAADVPMITKIDELENPDPATSHGQKGVGERSTVPVYAAVANAVADATGVRFYDLPMAPRNVLSETGRVRTLRAVTGRLNTTAARAVIGSADCAEMKFYVRTARTNGHEFG